MSNYTQLYSFLSSESYNTTEAAGILGVSRPTLLRWFREDRISSVPRDWRGWRIFTDQDIERIRRELGQSSDTSNTSVNSKMLAYLSRVPTFYKLSNEVLSALAECARFRGFLKGSRFFSPGDRSNGLHLLVKGRIKIFRLSPEGREQLITVVVPFQTLGEAAIFRQPETHSSYAVCEESSTILTLPSPKTRSLTVRYPGLALAFLGEFATRIEDLEQRLEETALYPLERRLAVYLLKNATPEHKVKLSESNSALAARFGVVRESVSRTLAKFEEQGLVRRRGRSLTLLSPEKLASL
jgi:CRP/FNR family transcriptional regulator, anaerobic regulatory protein